MTGVWRDRRHWELTVGPFRVSRWCEGAPCRYLNRRSAHPVSTVQVARR